MKSNKQMDTKIDIAVKFAGIKLSSPVFLASGTCGYADEMSDFTDFSKVGGFITKSITLKPRKGNPDPRIVETDSGMLNAIGLANIGLEIFIKEKLPILKKMKPAIFVNVAGETIRDYTEVIGRLSSEKAIGGFELNISCPNVKMGSICFGTEPSVIEEVTAAAKKAAGKKILMVKLTPSVTDLSVTARAAIDGGADALSLINTFTAMVIDIETARPALANRTGGLSGPAIKPIAVYLVNKVFREVAQKAKIPILGLGGIRTASDAIEFFIAGATAVAVGTANFSDPSCAEKIAEGIRDYCTRKKLKNLTELTGSLK